MAMPDGTFCNFESRIPVIDNVYVVRKRRSTGYEALNLLNLRSGTCDSEPECSIRLGIT